MVKVLTLFINDVFTDRESKQIHVYWKMKERKEKKQKDHKCTKLQQLSGF